MKTDAVTVGRGAELVSGESEAAIAPFVAEHYDRLLGLARLVCRDTSDAADAVQVGLEQAWRGRSTLRDDDRIRPWLDRIVVREAVQGASRVFAHHLKTGLDNLVLANGGREFLRNHGAPYCELTFTIRGEIHAVKYHGG